MEIKNNAAWQVSQVSRDERNVLLDNEQGLEQSQGCDGCCSNV